MSLFYSTSGLHNPELSIALPQHMLYPVAQQTARGLDLDYSSILVSRYLVMDEAMFDFITSAASPAFLTPMRTTLHELRAAELLFVDDFQKVIDAHRVEIAEKTTILLDDPLPWLKIARAQWRHLGHELLDFQHAHGDPSLQMLNTGHMGIENWLARTDRVDDQATRGKLYDVMSGRLSARRVPIEEVRGVMRFIISQIVLSDLIGNRTQLALLNWQDSQPYYDRLYSTRWDAEEREGQVLDYAHVLFDVVAPELRPNNVKGVIKFVRDGRAVGSLRSQLLSLIEAGKPLDAEWMGAYANEAIRRDITVQDRVRVFRWLGAGLGFIPGLDWGVGAVADTAVGAIDAAAGRPTKSLRWYYALQRIAARSRDNQEKSD